MAPLDFVDGKPRDGLLFGKAKEYYKEQFGAEPNFLAYAKVWVVWNEKQEIVGISGLQAAVDCPLFHCPPIQQTKEGLRAAEAVRDLMVKRLHEYLEDTGHGGQDVLIFVSETAARIWRRFLNRIGATPANRWRLTI